jgi:hypothetical protein
MTTLSRYEEIEAVMACDARSMSYEELAHGADLLRAEAERLMAQVREKRAANDDLQETLELRYGSGFAQWVVDGIEE